MASQDETPHVVEPSTRAPELLARLGLASASHVVPVHTEAGFVTRTVAFVLDAIVVTLLFSLAGVLVGLLTSLFVSLQIKSLTAVIGAVTVWAGFIGLYFSLLWTVSGQTIGMRVMGLRVLTVNGDHPRFIRALLRVAALFVLFPGVVLVLVTRRRQGLHDKLARTVVVYVEADQKSIATADAEAAASAAPPGPPMPSA